MPTYTIDQRNTEVMAPFYQERLRKLHDAHERIGCNCVSSFPLLYIAQVNGKYYIKRMPNTGREHDPQCPSYEPPVEISGLGGVLGQAIKEDPLSGRTIIQAGFTLVRRTKGRIGGEMEGNGSTNSPNRSESTVKSSATAKTRKLSLLGLLHYLWEEAKLNRWYPAMQGKRNWYRVRYFLLQAIAPIVVRDNLLSRQLIIPEYFKKEMEEDIARKRMRFIKAVSTANNQKHLTLFIGEVNEFRPARYGYMLKIKDWPDFPLFFDEGFEKQIVKKYEKELQLFRKHETHHLIAIGTFSLNETESAELQSVSLMMVDDHWLPYETAEELSLLTEVVDAGYSFTKSLRYSLALDRPLASIVLTAKEQTPTAMYIVPRGADHSFREILNELIASSALGAWVWNTEEERPALPSWGKDKTPEDVAAADGHRQDQGHENVDGGGLEAGG